MKELIMNLSFSPFDLFILVTLVFTTFWGGLRGLISQASAIISWLLSAYVASHYYQPVAVLFKTSPSIQIPAAIIVTFLGAFILLKIATRFVKNVAVMAGLKEFDRQMGALLGLCKGFIFCLLGTFFLVVASASTLKVVEESKSGSFFASLLAEINRNLPQSDLIIRYQTNVEGILDSKESSEQGETLGNEVLDLKEYLSKYVFSDVASDIVANNASNVKQGESASSWIDRTRNEEKLTVDTSGRSYSSWQRNDSGGNSVSESLDNWANEESFLTPNGRTSEVENGKDNRPSGGTTNVLSDWLFRQSDTSTQALSSPSASSESFNVRVTTGLDNLSSFLTGLGSGRGVFSNGGSIAQAPEYARGETKGLSDDESFYEDQERVLDNKRDVSDSHLRLKSRNFRINDRTVF